ncbi:MAG: hypothetical protein CMJ46_07180 [Planctomyces sp.]|nr:hypothetical protein [Planctomyces sp.]
MSFLKKNPHQVKALLISGATVVGVAAAAAVTSIFSEDRDIGITAWIAVAVIGTATMIATAKNSGPNADVKEKPCDPAETETRSPDSESILIPE